MDTGPREGDILLENNYQPGTSEWYRIEANNALYYERLNSRSQSSPETIMLAKLIYANRNLSLDDFFLKFSKNNEITK